MFVTTSVELYLEEGVGPVSDIIRDSDMVLQWDSFNEKELDDLKSAIDNDRKTLENRTTRSGLCITAAVAMLIPFLGIPADSVWFAITIAAAIVNIVTGIVFCFPEGELYMEPVTDDGGFGIHANDYVQRRICQTVDGRRVRELQKTYLRKSKVGLQVQKSMMVVGVISLISGVVL